MIGYELIFKTIKLNIWGVGDSYLLTSCFSLCYWEIKLCVFYHICVALRMIWSKSFCITPLPSLQSLLSLWSLLFIYSEFLLSTFFISIAGSLSLQTPEDEIKCAFNIPVIQGSHGQYQFDLPFVLHVNFCQAIDLIRQICRLLIPCF